MQKTEIYELEKSIWTEEDFSRMGWHDALVHGFATVINEEENWINELLIDIDYIFQWVQPKPPNSNFTFWVSPCTLIFKNFHDLVIDVDMNQTSTFYLEIADLKLLEKNENPFNKLNYYSWEIELQNGSISLKSEGYTQIVKKMPIHIQGQWLDINQRGGINFDKTPC